MYRAHLCLLYIYVTISYVIGRAEAEGNREQGGRVDIGLRVLENRVVG